MFDLKKLSEVALRQGMKLLADPRVMKLMSDPRVMKWTMQAFSLRGDLQTAVDERWKGLARRFRLATEEEVTSLKRRIRDLESTVQSLRGQDTYGDDPYEAVAGNGHQR
jgi:hypothetical protein